MSPSLKFRKSKQEVIQEFTYVDASACIELSCSTMANNSNLDDHPLPLLRQVSKALGLPVEAFFTDAPGEAGELLTLMRLWSSIEDKQARQRILTVARQEYERSIERVGCATARS